MYFRTVLCAATIALALAPAGPSAADAESQDAAFSQSYREIDALARAKDKAGLLATADELEYTWKPRSLDQYGRLLHHLCVVMRTELPEEAMSRAEVHALAERALATYDPDRDDNISIETHCGLVAFLHERLNYEWDEPRGDTWTAERQQAAVQWLTAWQRLEQALTPPPGGPVPLPTRNVPPPAATGLPAGIAPSAVKDPALRAEYEAAIEQNRQRTVYHNEQRRLASLKPEFAKKVVRYLGAAYSTAPYADEELQDMLDAHVEDEELRAQILDAAQNGRDGA